MITAKLKQLAGELNTLESAAVEGREFDFERHNDLVNELIDVVVEEGLIDAESRRSK